ncbi:hypothetical protein IC232_21095 [Microvirga sp. BT688]|uniref:hypothetical protein n=1 Tax=Microvirga sp. TaxID=1873136 RepID=UPI0016859E1C|nr:hypothetical protein [Microvirga sp.]MBD2749181.1 hypothetical protein [Microvirga sp.]
MKTASEYRKHAQECRTLAQQMSAGQPREQLLAMAKAWDSLANDRAKSVSSSPEPEGTAQPTNAQQPSKR